MFLTSLGVGLLVWVTVYLSISASWMAIELPSKNSSWLWLIIIFPVAEELAFRGFLMGLLDKILPERKLGLITLNNFLTSVLFSSAHIFARSLTLGYLVFIPSLWLGWVKEQTSSISLCAAIHVTWNLGLFVAASLA